MRIRLACNDGAEVAVFVIPPFSKRPDVVAWGDRVFGFHMSMDIDGEPCSVEYREVFCYAIPPGAQRAN